MKYTQIKPSQSSDIPAPIAGILNTFLDSNDNLLKTIDINGNVKLLMDTNLTPSLQHSTDAGNSTKDKIIVGGIMLSSTQLYLDNHDADLVLAANNTYRLPMSSASSYYPVGIVKSSWDLNVTIKSNDLTAQIDYTNPAKLMINWGDGTSDIITSGYNTNHIYATAGDYVIKISGSLTGARNSYITLSNLASKLIRTTVIKGIFGLTSFDSIFYQCTSLQNIPNGVLDWYSKEVTSLMNTFCNCKSLTVIPNGLLDNLINLTYITATFAFCGSLTSLPVDLFKYNINVTNFDYAFYNCVGLTTLPGDLFKYNINVTDYPCTFINCNSLTVIPDNLFSNNIKVTNFYATFQLCTGLTTLPNTLFKNNILVNTFQYAFRNCIGLVSIPINLFDSNVNATNFNFTFIQCYRLVSSVPTIWLNLPNSYGWACFNGDTQISNYNDIPANWK